MGLLATPENIIEFETLLIWRERVIDTILQIMALAAALLGVLAFLLRGGEVG